MPSPESPPAVTPPLWAAGCGEPPSRPDRTARRPPSGPDRAARQTASPGKRLTLALRQGPKRLLYPLLGLGRGHERPPADVDLGHFRRVVLVREMYTIGDSLVASPAVRALGEAYPRLEIAIAAGWRNAALWRHNPRLTRLFTLERGPKALRFAELARAIRTWAPEACLTIESLRCHATHDVLARLSGAAVRIRYRGAAFGAAHTDRAHNCLVAYPFGPRAHQIDVCAGVLRPFGIRLADRRLELVPGPAAEERAEAVLSRTAVEAGEPFVVVHPGSKQVHNRWPLERFLEVCRHCRGRGLRVLVSIGPSEREARRRLVAGGVEDRDLLPPLPIDALAAVVRRARLLVCPDTGVLHVGAAVGTPIVGLYGSGDPEVWRPPGVVRVVGADGAGQVGGIALEAVLTEIDASIAGFSGPTQ